MIRDLMLPVTGTSGDQNALSAAIALAASHEAHLSVVLPVSFPWLMPGPWGLSPDLLVTEMIADIRALAEREATAMRERLDKERISSEVRLDEAHLIEPPRAMALQARYADLGVVTAPRQDAADAVVARAFFSALLFESGRPVLVIPPHHAVELPIRHVVVAWKPSREATRALHDLLVLLDGLSPVASIDVVSVDPVVSDLDHGPDPGVDIATHLSRHALAVNVVNLPRAGGTVATTLLRHAADTNAQLLVAGGFGHSRLREWALGGTTHELLQALHLPVLFSH